jgi:hypothetical protein
LSVGIIFLLLAFVLIIVHIVEIYLSLSGKFVAENILGVNHHIEWNEYKCNVADLVHSFMLQYPAQNNYYGVVSVKTDLENEKTAVLFFPKDSI